ncbi:MAG: uroporphyrinogen-III synthase [Xanthomonadales bacterium]|nr:uroporphyrinogen-III synthase [Xanthomonadales bacterium]
MPFSHVLLTRPQPESSELAALLTPLGLEVLIQPAFTYLPVNAQAEQADELVALERSGRSGLLLFTSPRAVAHGLGQVPAAVLNSAGVAAIGPATARALRDAGVRVTLTARRGYTSEDLLNTLASGSAVVPPPGGEAFILAAPGGRDKLARGLEDLGWAVRTIHVYRPEPAAVDRPQLKRLEAVSGLLSVWTSGNTMRALSQRLPPAAWFRICQGEWLVISERLARLARAYGPSRIHRANGPGNDAILSAIRGLL